ncbi:hypothetical protein VFPBJ_11760 [Purpureocillium lilacinum]|uniref:Uncharacterized protein n=1 Tax=Purpureocillium lilacinum TaxID=33203 RepID=A0A179EWE0_PURLI|nr:hypothetical protein VFPBJ_11760 [Purpureocillium lilacinum]
MLSDPAEDETLMLMRRALNCECPTTFESGGLYGALRSRALADGNSIAFDLGRVWTKDVSCIEPGSSFNVVVYLLFEFETEVYKSWGHLRQDLAIDANLHRGKRLGIAGEGSAGGSIAVHFSSFSPLVGPMTYREVEQAVKHYLGWCPNLAECPPRWRRAERLTVELVPQSAMSEWVKARGGIFSLAIDEGMFPGHGFPCEDAACCGQSDQKQTDVSVDKL